MIGRPTMVSAGVNDQSCTCFDNFAVKFIMGGSQKYTIVTKPCELTTRLRCIMRRQINTGKFQLILSHYRPAGLHYRLAPVCICSISVSIRQSG